MAEWWRQFAKNVKRDRALLIIVLPAVVHYLVFVYYPMFGNIIAFEKYSPMKGLLGSEWVGLRYFKQFFQSPYFGRVLRNTLLISVYSILWGFPIPILFCADDKRIAPGGIQKDRAGSKLYPLLYIYGGYLWYAGKFSLTQLRNCQFDHQSFWRRAHQIF